MKIVLYRVGSPSEVIEIDGSLRSMQTLVGGYIQTVTYAKDLVLICNEEGRLQNLPGNRIVSGQLIVGDFFICSFNADELVSLSEKQIDELLEELL